MANTFLTPNMSLIIPVVLTDPGPDWGSNINSSLTILDSHTHSPGSGVQITPSGININTDLSYNSSNNAINLRSVRFTPQGSALSGAADLGCVYESGVDLYYNDGNGNQIRITQSGSVAGASGTITGLPSGTASASFSAITGTFTFQQATATGANLDIGSLIIRYPGSYPTPSGNAIVLAAPSSLSGTYQLTLPSLPSQTNVMSLTSAGIISSITYDQVGQGMTSAGANAVAASTNNPSFGGTVAQIGGLNIVTSNTNTTNPLAIVRGTVNSSGGINTGEGFSSALSGTGFYTITFTTSFTDTPAVVVSGILNATIIVVAANISSGGFQVTTTLPNGSSISTAFSFIAIGQL